MKLLDRPSGIGADQRSDAELIGAMRDGDENAYGVLFSRHRSSVVRFATSLTRDESTAEDVASEAFLRVFEMLDTGRVEIEAFRPYVLRAARNVFLNRVRRDSKIVFVDDYTGHDMDMDEGLVEGPDDPVRDRMVRAFESLPSTWQEVLWRTEVEGERPRHIAPSIGISPNATAALAVRAREGLRQEYLKTRLEGAEAPYDSFFDDLVKWVRGAAGRRASARVSKQLDGSPELEALAEALRDEDRQLKCAMWLALIGCAPIAAFGVAASGVGVGGSVAALTQSVEGFLRNQLPIAASVTAVVVVTGVAIPTNEVEGDWVATGTSVEAPIVAPSKPVPTQEPVTEDPTIAIPDNLETKVPPSTEAPVEAAPPANTSPASPAPPGRHPSSTPSRRPTTPVTTPPQTPNPPIHNSRFVPVDVRVDAVGTNAVQFDVMSGTTETAFLAGITASSNVVLNIESQDDGLVRAQARSGFCGTEQLQYRAADHKGQLGTGRLFITVRC